MFKHLTNFGFQRTGLQAFGMYLAYGLVNILFAFLAGMVLGMLNPAASFDDGLRLGTLVVIITCLVFGSLVIRAKGLMNFKSIAFVILAGVLAGLGGTLLGMIPVAYLSTLPRQGRHPAHTA